MRTMRIELEGSAGHVAIQRVRDKNTIRIDSVMREPKKDQAWKTWEIEAHLTDEALYKIAEEIQYRCAGVHGSNSDIHDYLRELQRFQD